MGCKVEGCIVGSREGVYVGAYVGVYVGDKVGIPVLIVYSVYLATSIIRVKYDSIFVST